MRVPIVKFSTVPNFGTFPKKCPSWVIYCLQDALSESYNDMRGRKVAEQGAEKEGVILKGPGP